MDQRPASRRPLARDFLSTLCLGVILLVVAGCATKRVRWQDRVGSYSYEEAVRELGPADRKETLSDGTVVGEWMVSRGQVYSTLGPTWGPAWGWRGGAWGVAPIDLAQTPDSYLRLQFGPDGRLVSWKNVYK